MSQTKEDMIKRFIQHGYKLLKNANINITINDNVSQTKEDMIKRFIQHGYKLLKNANINITINVAQNKEDNTYNKIKPEDGYTFIGYTLEPYKNYKCNKCNNILKIDTERDRQQIICKKCLQPYDVLIKDQYYSRYLYIKKQEDSYNLPPEYNSEGYSLIGIQPINQKQDCYMLYICSCGASIIFRKNDDEVNVICECSREYHTVIIDVKEGYRHFYVKEIQNKSKKQ